MRNRFHRLILWLGAAATSWAVASCSFSLDGAESLAQCIGRTAERLAATGAAELRGTCALGPRGDGMVVAFPPDPVASADLYAKGLSAEHVQQVNQLQLGDRPYERLNVLRLGRGKRSNRTTHHRRFVATPELLVCRAEDAEVDIVLRRDGDRVLLVGLE